ncbi:response regulator [Caulobacter sp. FWC2]|uniref:hybrid sensor histidine kinase/response regulator n=1 Tax=Caulobacter sp. FWC2 TaxID=69664 RepID=UPI000C154810|nr:response regulator [Caulobacter sp. FWC2]PIB93769.1 hybrid sensor histidine kinase/response regulator [Caulobacter sp. FWC2]
MWASASVKDIRANAKPIALVCAYAAAMAYSLFLASFLRNVPTLWTANAVAIAALMVLPRRQAIGFLIATTLVHIGLELALGVPWRFVAIVSVLDTPQTIIIALVMRAIGVPARVRDSRGLLAVIASASILTAIGSALVNGLLMASRARPFFHNWSEWTASNVLGAAIALPVVLILADRRHREGFKVRPLEGLATQGLVLATSAVIFAIDGDYRVMLFAPVLLAAFRGGPRAVAIAVTGSMAVAIPAVLHRTGIDIKAALGPLRHALIFHIVLYAVGLVSALALGRQARLQALLVRRTAAARAAQARAQAANRAKSDFVATISHEIRTPLNSILGFAALVADDPTLSTENRRRLDLVGRAGRSLAEIVGDLLDFAKVEAGRLDLTLTPVSPAALLRDAVDIVTPEAAAKGLYLRTMFEGDVDAPLALDETRLRQVLLNVLANAVKFTREGGVVACLTAGPAPGALRFEITDTGIGIAPEVQTKLFQRFSQGDSSISRSYGGTGLGLAISKALVSAMDGEIGVESQLDHGARFWITLTAQPAVGPASAACPAPETAPERAARVLLVDDHPMNRELGMALLTLAGCEVTTAEDGAQALEAVKAGGFDLVLMDVHMPGMDGLTATRAIRALPGPVSAIPIIALSADALPEQIARCRAAGMDDHVPKPIRREELFAAVARALEGRSEPIDHAEQGDAAHA